MVELRKRMLTTSGMLIFMKLYNAVKPKNSNSKLKETEDITNAQKNKLEKTILKKIQDNEDNISFLQMSLNKMKADYSRSLRVLESVKDLKASGDPIDKSLIGIIETEAKRLCKTTGEDSQFELELRLQGLKAEMVFLKKMG
jgi:hypothetical protein